jgi:hypothetical protein
MGGVLKLSSVVGGPSFQGMHGLGSEARGVHCTVTPGLQGKYAVGNVSDVIMRWLD